ncbi:MAG: hypothetical protein GH143_01180, partial [Calditrichaeota bacterium]|nr:hypothetical protein [Calditrichota bacterium]
YLALSFFILVFLAYGGAKLWNFPKEHIISVIYAAPQKTLAVGVPLLSTYFAHTPDILGIALLPLLFYHLWQLFISGIIKNLYMVKKL